MRFVVRKVVERHALRANVAAARIKFRSASNLGLREEPEAIVRRAGGDVSLDVVVTVDEPVSGRCCVTREADERLARISAQVASDDVSSLHSVLHKIRVAARLEGDVVLHA